MKNCKSSISVGEIEEFILKRQYLLEAASRFNVDEEVVFPEIGVYLKGTTNLYIRYVTLFIILSN